MPEDQLKAFLAAIQSDTSLQEKLRIHADPESVATIAQQAGFEISVEDLDQLQRGKAELSEKELEQVSGGLAAGTHPIGTQYLKQCCEA
jgi:predicted ribosomally synthesized peptide with nif11-like leader